MIVDVFGDVFEVSSENVFGDVFTLDTEAQNNTAWIYFVLMQ